MSLSVLMFCPQFAPLAGGAERQAEKLSRALVGQDVRVTVLTPKLVAESPEYEEDAGVVIRRFPVFDLCRHFPSIPGLGPANLVGLSAQTRRAALDAIEYSDVVHAHGASALTAFALSASRKLRKPFICKLASSGSGFDLKRLSEIGLGGSLLANYMRYRVTAWIATTEAVATALLASGIGQQKILRIPNGVEQPVFEGRRPNVSFGRFLYAGRISNACDRDFDTLLDAFFSLAPEYENIELALVGDGDRFEEFKARASRSAFASRIHMPGHFKDPGEWFAWAEIFVLPSRREGMSNALIEAMAYGLAPIANDIPANREVLDNGRAGFLTPAGEVNALAGCMKRLLDDRKECKRLQERALAHSRKYSITSVAQQYLAIYRELRESPDYVRALTRRARD